jgi:nitrate reductase (NAD(P)H)
MGMMNNCWFRAKIFPERSANGCPILRFEHPTVAGSELKGWMVREAQMSALEPTSVPQAETLQKLSTERKYTLAEVSNHNTEESCWIVVHGKVYDATSFLNSHPGGADSIMLVAGTDCTEEFDALHSSKAREMLKDYYIGTTLS